MKLELSTIQKEVLSQVSPVEFVCMVAQKNMCPINEGENGNRCDLCPLLDEDQKKLPEIFDEGNLRIQRIGLLNSRVFTICNDMGKPVVIMYYDGERGGMVTMARL